VAENMRAEQQFDLAGRFALRWTSPMGWDPAPDGFIPDVEWRPSRYWPDPPEGWEFWQIVADDDVVELFHQPLTKPVSRPHPVWVAPPNWPQPPPGWHPPVGWTPDRAWNPEPLNWEFWRQPQADEDAIARSKLTSRSDRLFQLNVIERLTRTYAEHLASMPAIKARIAVLPSISIRRTTRNGLERAHHDAREALTSARDSLLFVLRKDLPADDAAIGWLRVLDSRLRNALDWSRHALGLAPTETEEMMLLRLMNSIPYGAIDLEEASSGGANVNVVVPEAAWKQAEYLAVAALRQFGYLDAQLTESGSDGGVDVRSSRILAQVKHTSRPVGRPVVQQLIGAADGLPVAFFALTGYTQQAEDFAIERGVALFRISLPASVSPVNDRARSMATPTTLGLVDPTTQQ
jgi:hypothetical protein